MGTAADTDWSQILALYDQLLAVSPPPIVDLNRAAAVADLHGAAAALATLDDPHLADYHRFQSTRAELLRRLDRADEAAAAYDAALVLATNGAEPRFLANRRDPLPAA